jgi:hypothetical protein
MFRAVSVYLSYDVCPAGRYMYKGGKLVPTSLDLYLALEYCDQGVSRVQ